MKVLYFAWFREKLGKKQETTPIPDSLDSVVALRAFLSSLSPQHREIFAEPSLVKVAINHELADLDSALEAHDEVAFFPPITGG